MHEPRCGRAEDMLSFAEAAALTGTSRYRIGEVVKRAGVPTYTNARDGRKKFIRREDAGRLTAYFLLDAPADGGAP